MPENKTYKCFCVYMFRFTCLYVTLLVMYGYQDVWLCIYAHEYLHVILFVGVLKLVNVFIEMACLIGPHRSADSMLATKWVAWVDISWSEWVDLAVCRGFSSYEIWKSKLFLLKSAFWKHICYSNILISYNFLSMKKNSCHYLYAILKENV